MALTPGTRLGPYEIVALLGVGGMGEVYRARDTRLDRPVAIKILAPDLASDGEFQQRFHAEARAISQLTHPHICTLHDIGDHQGTMFLVMEERDTLHALAAALDERRSNVHSLDRKRIELRFGADALHDVGEPACGAVVDVSSRAVKSLRIECLDEARERSVIS